MDFVVTLIHGTFAQGAEWTHFRSSKLCKHLVERFGKEHVRFDRFKWTAANTHQARYDASRKLLAEYNSKKRLFRRTDIPQFVIAHSHGGTVLAYALRDDSTLAEALTGVAFLSTPFIQARERVAAAWVLKTVPWVAAVVAAMVVVFAWIIGRATVGFAQVKTPESIVLLVMLCLAALFTFAVVDSTIGDPETGLPEKLAVRVKRVVSEFSLSDLKSQPLKEKTLILRASADEASGTLTAAHMLTRLLGDIPARLAQLPSIVGGCVGRRFQRRMEKPTWQTRFGAAVVISVVLFLFTIVPIIKLWVGAESFKSGWPITWRIDNTADVVLFEWLYVGVIRVLLVVAFTSLFLAIVATPMIALIFRLAYGRWLLFPALFVELSVETVPPGEWRINQLDLNDRQVKRDFKNAWALTHSMSYNDPRAHQIIAEWIHDRLSPEAQGVKIE